MGKILDTLSTSWKNNKKHFQFETLKSNIILFIISSILLIICILLALDIIVIKEGVENDKYSAWIGTVLFAILSAWSAIEAKKLYTYQKKINIL